ncbi:MAG: YfhO family protein, partial [Eubacteriales bacterium]
STLNSSVIEFLNRMGYASQSHWSKYLGGTPVNDSLLGIKYIIDTGNSEKMLEYYDEAYTSGKYSAYLNPYALPLAYGVDSSVLEYDMSREKSHFERLNALVGSMLGTDDTEIFKSIKTEDTELYNCEKSSVANHIKYSVKDTDVSATITYTITAVSDGEIFMFIPSDYSREAKLSVNGSSHDTVFAKESDRIISLGIFEAGESVKVKITINNKNNNFYTGTGCDYFYYIDMDAFKDAFGRLADNPGFVINDDYTDTHLSGTISTADSNCTILTTVPYDEGWHIILDGEEIAYDKALDCLITFEIAEAGEHTLEFKYMPSAFVSGIRITMIGIAVFVIICVAEFIFRRIIRKRSTMPESARDILWELDDFDEDYEQYKLCAPDAPAKKPKEIISVSLSAVKNFFAGNKKGKNESDKSEADENSEVCTDSKTDIGEENLTREGEERISPDGSENQNEGNDNDENKENGDN